MEVEAVYHNGKLEPKSLLPLKEGQKVWVIVREDIDPADRLNTLRRVVDEWLTQQEPSPVIEPPELSSEELARLDAEFDELLAEIHMTSGQHTEDELGADADEAVRSVRAAHRRLLGQ